MNIAFPLRILAQPENLCCTIFAHFFGHFATEIFECGIVLSVMKLRLDLAAQKNSECALLTAELENVELRLRELEAAAFKDKELQNLAKSICAGTPLVPSGNREFLKRGRNAMNKATFKALERKLDKKNAELSEVRESRKKLDDREREICAEIEKLQAQKIEIIFDEIKREVRSDNLDVSSSAILPVLEALRKNQQTPEISPTEEKDSAPVSQP